MKESFSLLRQKEMHWGANVRLYDNVQADDYPAHWNNAFEVIMPVENDYSVLIGEVLYQVMPYEILIIPPGSVHEIFAPATGRRYFFMIDTTQIYAIEGLAAVQHCFYPCVHLREDEHPALLSELRTYFQRAVDEYNSNAVFGAAMVNSWLSLFFAKTGRALLDREASDRRQGTQRQQRAMTVFLDSCLYISQHCHENLTLQDVAEYSGYSKYHFARTFKTYAGISFYDFLLRQRLLLCERMLGDVSLSITEVAFRSGFGSIASFNRIFKQYKGVTPSDYRRLKQQTIPTISHDETAIFEK